MERQTELMQNILDSLDAVSESDTQSLLENKKSHMQDIVTGVQEYTDFTKTIVYCAITGLAVWQVLCKTWKHINKKHVSCISCANNTCNNSPCANSNKTKFV